MSDDNSILMITVPVFIDYADKSAMLLLQRLCVPSIEVSPPIISYEALRKSFSAQPLFGYAVQLHLRFCFCTRLICSATPFDR